MANECQVFEQRAPRFGDDGLIITVPFLAKQVLSSTGVSAAFNASTVRLTVYTSLAGTLEFSTTAGTAPGGSGDTIPIPANTYVHFDVKPGAKVRFA